MSIGKDEFRAALGRFPSGVTIVTAKDAAGRAHGITVSAFCSVSLAPPMILVCLDKNSGSHAALLETEHFAVHILPEHADALSNRFAARIPDKFEGVAHHAGLGGVPVLDDALATLECRRAHAHEGGDHTIFVGLVERSAVRDENPLVYWHGNYRKLEEK